MTELIEIALAAILIGLSLGLLGSGGAILTVPTLTYIIGQNEKVAIASSLAIVGLIAFTGSIKYQHSKMVHWPIVWLFGVPSMIASYVAAGFSVYLSGNQQMSLFAIVILLAAFSMLKNKIIEPAKVTQSKLSIKLLIVGAITGCVSGLVGVGGGFLIVPALLAFTRINMVNAVATSLVIITLQSLTGFIKYYSISIQENLIINWQVIFIVALVGSISSILGQQLSAKISQQKLKKIFSILLLMMSSFILINSSGYSF